MFAFLGSHSRAKFGGVHNGSGDGVYACRVAPSGEALEVVETVGLPDPTWLAVLPSRRILYAACHTTRFEGSPGAGIAAFTIGENGGLTQHSSQRIAHPHVTMISPDGSERFLFAASAAGGAVSVLPIAADGSLEEVADVAQFEGEISIAVGEVPEPVPVPWVPGLTVSRVPRYGEITMPHCVRASLSGDWVLVTDMGKSGIGVLGFDERSGTFTSKERFSLNRRAGPRIIALHPNGHSFYCVNEFDSTVSVMELDLRTGAVEEVQAIPSHAPDTEGRSSASGIALDAAARRLWTVNRGHNSLSTFDVDANGRLKHMATTPCGGHFPWHLELTPDGRHLYVANPLVKSLAVFSVDPDSGIPSHKATLDFPAISTVFLR